MSCLYCKKEIKNISNGNIRYHIECLKYEKLNPNNKALELDLEYEHEDGILFIEKKNDLSYALSEVLEDLVKLSTSMFSSFQEKIIVKDVNTNIYSILEKNDNEYVMTPLSSRIISRELALQLYKENKKG